MTDRHAATPIDIDRIPELDTVVGMIGTLREVEVGGQVCLETGVLILTTV